MQRRNLLRTVGAASALGTGATGALATQSGGGGGENGGGQECALPDCIHPTLGYSGLAGDSGDSLPNDLQPDHEVALETRTGGGAGSSNGDDNGGSGEGSSGGNGGAGGSGPDGNGAPQPPESAEELPEFVFEPTGLAVESGDVVRFTLASPDHTVTAYHPALGRQRRVPEGVPPFSSPVLGAETFWLYRFDEPGVYDVLCAPHEIFGMVGRIVVDGGEANFGEETYPAQRGPEFTAATVLDDDALDPENVAEAGAVSWNDLADESMAMQIEFAETAEEDSGGDGSGEDGSGGDGAVSVGDEQLEDGDLEITEHEFVAEGDVFEEVYVEGVVENTGDETYDSVEVQVTVYDADGNQLDQYIDITSDLDGGDSWQFEALILESSEDIAEYDIEVEGTQF
ncbi:FxLYD domain-containing protein [Natronoarchaeum mannanilyticum]|uniref:Blue (type 1) copper domain-containing protein n=1 Tax=Natronoarchaeum mannanilyticum TaxID=926360 RepID=A0AAV3T9V9_9EURY